MLRTFVVSLALSALLGAAPAASQQNQAPPAIQAVEIAEGLTVLFGAGGNIVVSSGADGPIIVDDQFDYMVPGVQEAVAALQEGPIRFVINTHHHGDHTGGNDALGRLGSVIIAHANVRKRMSERQVAPLLGRDDPPRAAESLPVVTFDDGMVLHWNGEEIAVEHVEPAHTDGDSLVWFHRAGAVHMGDTYFNGMYPFVDIFSGGTTAGIIGAADAVLARADGATKIVPGHGPLSNVTELRAYRDMLTTVRDRVSAAQAAGTEQAAFVASAPLSDLDAKWGGGFMKAEQLLGLIWADLAR
jgi:glyoxylase-like metal-dependent hydrolase (beta-lactamase superfamily II)